MNNSREELLLQGERLDDLGINGYAIIQDPEYFCFGIDAVLLSSFVRAHESENVLDLCTGNGIIPILLAAKTKARQIYGIEIQKTPADMAERSVRLNGLEDRIRIILGDIKNTKELVGEESVDVISVNPPYLRGKSGFSSERSPLAIARHETLCELSDILYTASSMLKAKGRFYMVHRPFRLEEILSSMAKARIEPKKLRFVYPYEDREANLVLIEGIKEAAAELRISPPLIVYEKPGKYTPEVMNIYGLEQDE